MGAGITGLWQSLILAQNGYSVRLIERSPKPFAQASSIYAGAMLAPYCEAETALPVVKKLGIKSLELWRKHFPETVFNGSLVVAHDRDKGEIDRFARFTDGHRYVDRKEISNLEPDLSEQFQEALFYENEGHVDPEVALPRLLEAAEQAGVSAEFGVEDFAPPAASVTIDCRGLAAQDVLQTLRGVRGERAIIRISEIELARPVRLLHPRFPLYIVPWSENRFMVGATVIEREDAHPPSVRSTLELLSSAYALNPAFGEAEILDLSAGVRPAFEDNCPRIILDNQRIYVNGLYRHGFLMAPALATLVERYLTSGEKDSEIIVEDRSQW